MDTAIRILSAVVIASLPLPLSEFIDRHFDLSPGLIRKLSHVSGCIAASCLIFLIPLSQIAVIGIGFSLMLIIIRRHKLAPSLYKISRLSYGEVCFPLGVSIAALLSSTSDMYLALILVMGFADTAADIIGTRYAKVFVHIPGGRKSWQGSLAFFITALSVLLIIYGPTPLSLLAFAAAAMTLAEALSGIGIDNATIPLTGGVILKLL